MVVGCAVFVCLRVARVLEVVGECGDVVVGESVEGCGVWGCDESEGYGGEGVGDGDCYECDDDVVCDEDGGDCGEEHEDDVDCGAEFVEGVVDCEVFYCGCSGGLCVFESVDCVGDDVDDVVGEVGSLVDIHVLRGVHVLLCLVFV